MSRRQLYLAPCLFLVALGLAFWAIVALGPSVPLFVLSLLCFIAGLVAAEAT